MEEKSTSLSNNIDFYSIIASAESICIEIYKLYALSKFKEALEKWESVSKDDNSAFWIKNMKANILFKIGGYGKILNDLSCIK